MPVCKTLIKFGVCKEPDCPYKHTLEDIKVGLPHNNKLFFLAIGTHVNFSLSVLVFLSKLIMHASGR